jgi:hypothetical protein
MNLDALLEAMPNFRSVKSISFDLLRCRRNYRKRLLKAFRNNRSIVHSNITNDNLDAPDRQRLQAYHDRNRYLASTIRAEAMAMASTESRQAEDGADMAQLGSLLPPLFLECDSSTVGSVFGAMARVDIKVGPETTGSE